MEKDKLDEPLVTIVHPGARAVDPARIWRGGNANRKGKKPIKKDPDLFQ